MQGALCNLGLYRMTMGRETEAQQYVEKNKFFNQLDEAFGFMCVHISKDILFHLEGLRTQKEAWDKLESLFGKQDDLRGNILENELIALQPSSFKYIQQFFTKYKSIVLQCKQCGLERKDEQLVLYVLRNIGSKHSLFLCIPFWNGFHPELEYSFSRCFC